MFSCDCSSVISPLRDFKKSLHSKLKTRLNGERLGTFTCLYETTSEIGQSTNRFGKPQVIIYNVLQISNGKTMDERILAKEYDPHPMGSETKETMTDEGRDLEYYHVPADNQGTSAADYLVDFKTVSFLSHLISI